MKKILIPFIVLFQIACHSSATFEQYQELPAEVWDRYNVVKFTTHIPDSGLYRISLHVRHTTDYEMSNLWCFLSTQSNGKSPLRDTVNVKIAELDGRWLGKGGRLKNITQPIHRSPIVLPQGEITFSIEQGMRIEKMKGIKSVGLRIEKVTEQEK